VAFEERSSESLTSYQPDQLLDERWCCSESFTLSRRCRPSFSPAQTVYRKHGLTHREEIDRYIGELQQTMIVAVVNYDIWRVFTDTRSKYAEAMEIYNQFFRTSIHAHFVALVIAVYRLYETKPSRGKTDTFNIPTLLTKLTNSGDIPASVIVQLNETQSKVEPIWNKIKILRNRVFGHRSQAHTIPELFQEAAITPNELDRIIELTKSLLNTLTYSWNRSTYPFDTDAKEDTIRLLDDLTMLHKR
jgi:hypothetical protein